ncbi:hypothetical protein HOLleu_26052 [Holothuria leucospilota]|uniref:Uncharacterized protein n=1 Tax=Holothuria leucospilota TaxID=206669 RepID=A0A9Q1BTC7_HOLLE|nr:hypothetical protein HOLleu_26052 [Holothuria leucospilota]
MRAKHRLQRLVSGNPFNFEHFGANFLAVYMDGEQIPYKPLKPSFTEDGGANYIRAYHTLFSGTDKMNQDEGNAISRKDYTGGTRCMRLI